MSKLKMHYDANLKIDIAYDSDWFTLEDENDSDAISATRHTLEEFIEDGINAALMEGTKDGDTCKVTLKKKKFTMKMEEAIKAEE